MSSPNGNINRLNYNEVTTELLAVNVTIDDIIIINLDDNGMLTISKTFITPVVESDPKAAGNAPKAEPGKFFIVTDPSDPTMDDSSNLPRLDEIELFFYGNRLNCNGGKLVKEFLSRDDLEVSFSEENQMTYIDIGKKDDEDEAFHSEATSSGFYDDSSSCSSKVFSDLGEKLKASKFDGSNQVNPSDLLVLEMDTDEEQTKTDNDKVSNGHSTNTPIVLMDSDTDDACYDSSYSSNSNVLSDSGENSKSLQSSGPNVEKFLNLRVSDIDMSKTETKTDSKELSYVKATPTKITESSSETRDTLFDSSSINLLRIYSETSNSSKISGVNEKKSSKQKVSDIYTDNEKGKSDCSEQPNLQSKSATNVTSSSKTDSTLFDSSSTASSSLLKNLNDSNSFKIPVVNEKKSPIQNVSDICIDAEKSTTERSEPLNRSPKNATFLKPSSTTGVTLYDRRSGSSSSNNLRMLNKTSDSSQLSGVNENKSSNQNVFDTAREKRKNGLEPQTRPSTSTSNVASGSKTMDCSGGTSTSDLLGESSEKTGENQEKPLNPKVAEIDIDKEKPKTDTPEASNKRASNAPFVQFGLSRLPMKCNYCGQLYSSSERMTGHMQIHEYKISHSCKYCYFRMASVELKEKHEKTHPKKYKCKICTKKEESFVLLEELNYHMMMKHDSPHNPHRCVMCPRSFPTSDILRTHSLETHSLAKPVACTYCLYCGETVQILINHLKTQHNFNLVSHDDVKKDVRK